MNWVRHDEEKRQEHLSNLLKHVRLPLLTAKYLTDQVDEEVRTTVLTSFWFFFDRKCGMRQKTY